MDTHVFLWMHLGQKSLGKKTKRILSDPDQDLLLSIGSVWEIAIKVEIGKLTIPAPPEAYVTTRMKRSQIELLPISMAAAFEAARLPWQHRDPFDRLLVAQALLESCTILSADRRLLERGDLVEDARS